MSPEQFNGRPIAARSDLYSLGVMAYEMLMGSHSFNADTAWEWATQHMTQPPIPIESVPGGAELPGAMRGAIARSLAKSPDDRFETIEGFAEAFAGRAWAGTGTPVPVPASYTPAGGNVAFPTPGAMEEPRALDKRGSGRTVLLATAGVIAIASIGAIALALKGGSGRPADVPFDNAAAPAPATSLTPAAIASGDTTAAPAADIPPLSGASGGSRPHQGPHSASSQSASHAGPPTAHSAEVAAGAAPGAPSASPSAAASQVVPPELTALPKAEPPPARGDSPAKYDGLECQRARTLRALGHPRQAQVWASACTAKGGAL